MRLKRFKALFMGAVLLFGFTGCGSTSPNSSENNMQSPQASLTEENSDTEGGRILIAYFSAGENSDVDVVSSASVTMVNGEAKGRLRVVADMIQAETGGDIFSIQTSVEYPGDGMELIDYAAVEQDENARPELTSHIENLDDYDTIFVGYPKMEYGFDCVLCVSCSKKGRKRNSMHKRQ